MNRTRSGQSTARDSRIGSGKRLSLEVGPESTIQPFAAALQCNRSASTIDTKIIANGIFFIFARQKKKKEEKREEARRESKEKKGMSASSLSDLENNPAAVTFARREAAVCLWIHTIIERAKSGWPASNAFPLPAEKLPPAPIASLSALVDGIALCSALTWIKPRSVPKVHLNTDSSFGGRENLSFALTAMEEMGVSKWDLFSVPDLQNLQNPAKVVDSLEILALFLESPIVLKAGKEVLSSEIRSNPLPRLETLSAASGRLPPAELFRRSILSLDV